MAEQTRKEKSNCYICRSYAGYGMCKIKEVKYGVPSCDLKKTGCCRLDNENEDCPYFKKKSNSLVWVFLVLCALAFCYLVFQFCRR